MSIRADQRSYFIQCNKELIELHDRVVLLKLVIGIYSNPPPPRNTCNVVIN
jgi:hypothetical protein